MAEQVLRCPKCGGEIRHTSAFCEHCGTPVKITVATVKEDTSSKETLDPQKEKAKEEYFKKRAAISNITVSDSGKPEVSVDVNAHFMKLSLVGGLLLGMNFITLARIYSHGLVTKTNVYWFLLAGMILPLLLNPLFRIASNKVNRRAIRRFFRFISAFNCIACTGPLVICLVCIYEYFLEQMPPMGYIVFHNMVLLACLVVCSIIALVRFLKLRVNKSISDITLALHFDNLAMIAFILFATVIYIFAYYV